MKMWDGRFSKPTDQLMEELNNSLPVDRIMVDEDIAGSIAWAQALSGANVISEAECKKIVGGLQNILKDAHDGRLAFLPSDEDIHMAVERILVEKIGDTGAKLHTGRSRNDQVVTDTRMYTKKALHQLDDDIRLLQKSLFGRVESDREIIIPCYTHLQQAQPVYICHYWLSFFFALQRERSRIAHAIDTTDMLPLGSGACAGSGFAVDRSFLAQELGFAKVLNNSIDGVAARDFVLETLAAISSIGILLSRYAEDLIIWSSTEFSLIELDDAWSTGSSMMPQKKNPDSLELVRGKAGRFIGNYTRFAATLKGVGLTYYKDLQEDKEPLFDSISQLHQVLLVFGKVIETLQVNTASAQKKLSPFLWATDVADYLVVRGLPFRQAHGVVGKLVGYCVKNNVALNAVSLDRLRGFSPLFNEDVTAVFSWDAALAHRNVAGGTGPKSIRAQIVAAKKMLGSR